MSPPRLPSLLGDRTYYGRGRIDENDPYRKWRNVRVKSGMSGITDISQSVIPAYLFVCEPSS